MAERQTRVVLLTGCELRHDFIRISLALNPRIQVQRTFCEKKTTLRSLNTGDRIALTHAKEREQSEDDFFRAFVELAPDHSNSVSIPGGSINDANYRDEILSLNPDILVCYGTSIIREPLLSDFEGRFLNIHLGLSPYYRGAGTNFWPIVRNEPEFVGVTFMQIDAGVDSGPVIHQMRATMFPNDSIHSVGNRLIRDIALVLPVIVDRFPLFRRIPQDTIDLKGNNEKVFRSRDFSGASVVEALEEISRGSIRQYLENKDERDGNAPIVEQWEILE